MIQKHTKAFGVYHWDTFESAGEDTFLVGEADTLQDAEQIVQREYGSQLRPKGADQVHIINENGDVVRRFRVG